MKFDASMLKVYLIGGTQDAHHDSYEYLEKVEEAMNAGITAFQYREKDETEIQGEAKQVLGRRVVELGHKYHVPVFVDDDVDLALKVGADGVHVGQKDEAIDNVINTAAGKLMIGYSCNTADEIKKANTLDKVDYVGCGPVFPTQSKADADPALGTDKLKELNGLSKHPMVAIGGLTEDNMKDVLNTGVAGLAMISMVFGTDKVAETIKDLLALYKN